MKRVVVLVLFFFLVFLSLVPRSTEVLNKNYLFGFDQGRDYLAVKSIIIDHKLTLIGSEIGAGSAGFQGIFHGPFHYYFLAIPFFLFKGDPYGGIILTFFYGLLTIFLSYLLGKKLFGTFGGLVTALLVAMSPPFISQSRFVWNSHGAPVFILLAFYCVYRLCLETEERKKYKYIFGAAFFSGFIYNFQLAIAIPMSIALGIFLILVLRMKKVKASLSFIVGSMLAFAPMILFEIRHDFMTLKGILGYLINPGKTEITLKFIELLLKDHIGAFLYNFYDTFPRQNIVSAEMIILILGFLLFYVLLKETSRSLKYFIVYLVILPFVSFFVLAFLRNAVYPYYLIHLNLAYIFIFSYIFVYVLRERNIILATFMTAMFIIFSVLATFRAIETFRNDYIDYGGDAKIRGKLNAIDYIYTDARGEPFCLLVFTPPVYTYAYDYLIWWYGSNKYHYMPCKEKEGTFYLWVEIDSSKPWSYKGWLETVIKTGSVLETKELPSGFIIQKRISKGTNEI